MRFLEAAGRQLVALEPDHATIKGLAEQAGFSALIEESPRRLVVEVQRLDHRALLLFNAAEPANLGWFSRCQFYVDGFSGVVLQTPLSISNCFADRRVCPDRLRIAMTTELPAGFQLPGRQSVSEQVVYALFFSLLNALTDNGVAVCGKGSVHALCGASRPQKR